MTHPTDCSPPGSSIHGDSLGRNTRVGGQFPSPGDLSNPGFEPRSLALQVDSLPTELQGNPTEGWSVRQKEKSGILPLGFIKNRL